MQVCENYADINAKLMLPSYIFIAMHAQAIYCYDKLHNLFQSKNWLAIIAYKVIANIAIYRLYIYIYTYI